MAALNISHQQSSAIDAGVVGFGGFNFSPNKGMDTKTMLMIGAAAVVVFLVLNRKRK